MRPVLVTGCHGQLAISLQELSPRFAAAGYRLHCIGRPDLDFDRPETLPAVFNAIAPALLINTAAWTNVDTAEAHPAAADRANHTGPAALARLCAEAGIPMLHLSTDYVFDGTKAAPYTETDHTHPLGVYGRTKSAGEQAVLAACPWAVVLRTAWLYAPRGRNFVTGILQAARRQDRLRVVTDQIGCPTAAADLADAILRIAMLWRDGRAADHAGIFHAAGTAWASRHDLAQAVLDIAADHGWPHPPIDPIPTQDWPAQARRPADSRLDSRKLATTFGLHLPDWQHGLERVVVQAMASWRGRAD